MGELFMRKQAAAFRTQHAAEFDRMKAPNLISRMKRDVMTRNIRCAATSAKPQEGADVVLNARNDRISVLVGGRAVGTVDGVEAAGLRDALAIGSGVLRARVVSVPSLGKAFVVRLKELP